MVKEEMKACSVWRAGKGRGKINRSPCILIGSSRCWEMYVTALFRGQAGVGGEEGELLGLALVGKMSLHLGGLCKPWEMKGGKSCHPLPPVLPIFKSKRVPRRCRRLFKFSRN